MYRFKQQVLETFSEFDMVGRHRLGDFGPLPTAALPATRSMRERLKLLSLPNPAIMTAASRLN